jgi:hypothetical protein
MTDKGDDMGFFEDAAKELEGARKCFPPFHSSHEGYAVLLEELDELWQSVRLRPKLRNANAMRRECVQIAAMAARFAEDVCDSGRANDI